MVYRIPKLELRGDDLVCVCVLNSGARSKSMHAMTSIVGLPSLFDLLFQAQRARASVCVDLSFVWFEFKTVDYVYNRFEHEHLVLVSSIFLT